MVMSRILPIAQIFLFPNKILSKILLLLDVWISNVIHIEACHQLDNTFAVLQ